MALSAACCLRYAWWAACYSEWYGLPSYAEQLGMAAARASFYLRITITLQAATLAVVWSDQAAPYRPVTTSQIRSTPWRIGGNNDCRNLFIRLAPKLGPFVSYSMIPQSAAFDSGGPHFYPSGMVHHTTAIAMACCCPAPACG